MCVFIATMWGTFVFVCLCVGVFGEKADQFKDVLLDKHNEMRRKQGASNMNALVRVFSCHLFICLHNKFGHMKNNFDY